MAQERLNMYSYAPNTDNSSTGSTQPKASDEFDGCISTVVLSIIRAVTGDLLERIIERDMRENCNGCAIDHPSQHQHTCLYDPEDYYLHINAKRLMTKLYKPWLKYTLARAIKLCRIFSIPSLEKIQAVAETIYKMKLTSRRLWKRSKTKLHRSTANKWMKILSTTGIFTALWIRQTHHGQHHHHRL